MRSGDAARETLETKVRITIGLDGGGESDISTGVAFFDHMLAQIARHGMFDLKVEAEGDLEIDSHHTVEDVGIVLGEAIDNALGDRRGISRMADATVPMDDALVTVSIDLVDRPYCHMDLPDEMLAHFMRSFAMEARITLHNVVVRGKNFHHVNEACFKALGMALFGATRPSGELRSTKGHVKWK